MKNSINLNNKNKIYCNKLNDRRKIIDQEVYQ